MELILKKYSLSERGDSTVVLMCALVLLMMAFFAVLNSLSVKNTPNKEKKALGSFLESLGVLPGGIMLDEGKNYLLPSAPMLDPTHDLASKGIDPEAVFDLVHSSAGKKWYQIVTLKKSNEGLNISLSNQNFFAPGSAELEQERSLILDKISEIIKTSSCDALIRGHSDNTPLGSAKYASNWELSATRAMNVLKYFLKQGIPLSRLEAAGYGEYDPLFPNDTPEHRALNRRVEIQLVQREKKLIIPEREQQDAISIHGFIFKIRDLIKK